MSAWTNGDVHVVLGPRGLSLHRGQHAELVLALAQLGGELVPVAESTCSTDGLARPLAVDPAAKVVFTVNHERSLVRATLEPGGRALLYPWLISTLVAVDHERVLAAHVTGTKARALTSVVWGIPPADAKLKWEREFESAKPTKVEWPNDLIWDKPIWSRKVRWTTDPALLEIDSNPHGVVLIDTDSAVVGLLRHDPKGFVCILRTPKEGDSTIAATATARGVLVATTMPSSRRAAICHFNEVGGLLQRHEFAASEVGPITLVDDAIVCVVERREVVILGLADLQVRTRLSLGTPLVGVDPPGRELPPPQLVLRGSKHGFVLAGGGRFFLGHASGGQWTVAELDVSTVPEPGNKHEASIGAAEIAIPEPGEPTAAPPVDLVPRIIGLAPLLSLDSVQPKQVWHHRLAEPFELEIKTVSMGGPAETGIYVEVSGDAIANALIEPVLVRAVGVVDLQANSSESTPWVENFAPPAKPNAKSRVAVFEAYRLPAGIEPNKDKKIKPHERFLEYPPDTFLTFRLTFRPLALGTGLLSVRIGFHGLGQAGSLSWGKPLTISVTGYVPPPPPPPEPTPADSDEPGLSELA